MSEEHEEGKTRGYDDGRRVKLVFDDFVARLVKDPNDPPDLLLLSGYLGASSEEGHVRLYLDEELAHYVEIPEGAIRHTHEISLEQSPLGGSLVWIERAAEVVHGKVGTERQRATFLEGQIARDFMGGAAAAAPGLGAARAGRVAIPDPSRANPGCTIIGPGCRKTVFPDDNCTIIGPGCGKSVYPKVCTTDGPPDCPNPSVIGPGCMKSEFPKICTFHGPGCPGTEFDPRCPTYQVLCTEVSPCVYTEAKCWESGYFYCPKKYVNAPAGRRGFAAGAAAEIPQTRLPGCQSQSGPCAAGAEFTGGLTLTGIFCTVFGEPCRQAPQGQRLAAEPPTVLPPCAHYSLQCPNNIWPTQQCSFAPAQCADAAPRLHTFVPECPPPTQTDLCAQLFTLTDLCAMWPNVASVEYPVACGYTVVPDCQPTQNNVCYQAQTRAYGCVVAANPPSVLQNPLCPYPVTRVLECQPTQANVCNYSAASPRGCPTILYCQTAFCPPA